MRIVAISGFLLIVFLLACQQSSVQTVEPKVVEPQKTVQTEDPQKGNEAYFIDNLLQPSAAEDCLKKIDVGEAIVFDLSRNPYYLRGDFDGDKISDYAISIVGKTSKKRGLVICRNGKIPHVFGEVAKSKTPLNDTGDDNFPTSWDIVSNSTAKDWYKNLPNETNRKLSQAKGELIEFIYEIDGILYIYWDGKAFRAAGE